MIIAGAGTLDFELVPGKGRGGGKGTRKKKKKKRDDVQ